MTKLIDLIVAVVVVLALNSAFNGLEKNITKAALEKADKGLPKLEPFTQKLTGYKPDY